MRSLINPEPTDPARADATAVVAAARRILGETRVGFLTTNGTAGPTVRMVGHIRVDEDLRVVFATMRSTRKIVELSADPAVVYSAGDDRSAACLYGTASIDEDLEHRRAAWGRDLVPYFSGPEDSEYVLVVVRPHRIEVWSEPERIWTGPNDLIVAAVTRSGGGWVGPSSTYPHA